MIQQRRRRCRRRRRRGRMTTVVVVEVPVMMVVNQRLPHRRESSLRHRLRFACRIRRVHRHLRSTPVPCLLRTTLHRGRGTTDPQAILALAKKRMWLKIVGDDE